jgi:predicted Fe-Mo cluster-binding NifX family protein
MNAITIAIPVTTDGAVFERLAKAPVAVTCVLRDGQIVDWTEHAVGWDQTYGVDVMGNHHARVMRFMQEHDVTDVVAADVCDNMRRSLEAKGVVLHADFAGDARTAVISALQPA